MSASNLYGQPLPLQLTGLGEVASRVYVTAIVDETGQLSPVNLSGKLKALAGLASDKSKASEPRVLIVAPGVEGDRAQSRQVHPDLRPHPAFPGQLYDWVGEPTAPLKVIVANSLETALPIIGFVRDLGASEYSEATSAMWSLLQELRSMGSPNEIPGDVAKTVLEHKVSTLTEYQLQRIVEWSRPRYQLDRQFVSLTLLIDGGEDAIDRWQPHEERYQDLGDVLDDVPDGALVQ